MIVRKIVLGSAIIIHFSDEFNKRGGGAKNAKSLNVEVGINVEGGKI